MMHVFRDNETYDHRELASVLGFKTESAFKTWANAQGICPPARNGICWIAGDDLRRCLRPSPPDDGADSKSAGQLPASTKLDFVVSLDEFKEAFHLVGSRDEAAKKKITELGIRYFPIGKKWFMHREDVSEQFKLNSKTHQEHAAERARRLSGHHS